MAVEKPARHLSAARLALAVKRLRAETASLDLLASEPIAIIGLGCRFPGGAANPSQYWDMLQRGDDAVRRVPDNRWNSESVAEHLRFGGYLDAIDGFDAGFFSISPREATTIDPQHRLLLEVAWEAIWDAGVRPEALSGQLVGVFASIYSIDYSRMQLNRAEEFGAASVAGYAHSVAAGRISYLLNLKGPCLTIDTACSSSLVAIHLACQSLRARECDSAIAGGVSLKVLHDELLLLNTMGMLSKQSRCKTFDANADGFVTGEGCGVIILRRLADALANGDPIRAVIRGSAVNHDGRTTVLTAPNGLAHEAVIRQALRNAAVDAADVSYIEAHGTGTSLGDPIELHALDAVYGAQTPGASACVLGAVKTNLGHLEAAAGFAGLIKVVLSMEHGSIPQNLHFKRLNPQSSLAGSRLKIATKQQPWERGKFPRLAGVSSLGFSGTNAHVILEEAPAFPSLAVAAERPEQLLVLSAKSDGALHDIVLSYILLLRDDETDSPPLSSLCAASAIRRTAYDYRVAVQASTRTEIADRLSDYISGRTGLGISSGSIAEWPKAMGIGFIFSGQASAWTGMGRDLLDDFPVFRDTIEAIDISFRTYAGWSILTELIKPAHSIEDTEIAQPLIFAVQVAIARLLESFGIRPTAVAGHSVGEVAAACVSGILSLEDSVRLIYYRSISMRSARGNGRMLAVATDAENAERLTEAYRENVSVAAYNSKRSQILSGDSNGLEQIRRKLDAAGMAYRWLDVEYAFHSQQMEPAAAELCSSLGTLKCSSPTVAFFSTVTGKQWTGDDGDTSYWCRGIRHPVRFHEAIDGVLLAGCNTILEIGPHPVLLQSVRECAAQHENPVYTLPTLQRSTPGSRALLRTLGSLFAEGRDIHWPSVFPGVPSLCSLPLYPWQRRSYWLPKPKEAAIGSGKPELSRAGANPLLGTSVESPFLQSRVFNLLLDVSALPYLSDHTLEDEPILPMAAFVEIVSASVRETIGGDSFILLDIAVGEPLALSAAKKVQVAVGEKSIELMSEFEGSWKSHLTARYEKIVAEPGRIDIEGIQKRCTNIILPSSVYSAAAEAGLSFGPSFRTLQDVRCGEGEAFGHVRVPVHLANDASRYGLHPTLLDGCFQLVLAALGEHGERLLLPLSVERFQLLRSAEEVLVHVVVRGADAVGVKADLLLATIDGDIVAKLTGFFAKYRSVQSVRPAPSYELTWRASELSHANNLPKQNRQWLLIGRGKERLTAIEEHLEQLGIPAARIADTDIASAMSAGPSEVHLVYATASKSSNFNPDGWTRAPDSELQSFTNLIKSLSGKAVRLWVLTANMFEVVPQEGVSLEETALFGMARTLMVEQPELAVTLLDFRTHESATECAARTITEVDAGGRDSIVGFRNGLRYVARLTEFASAEGKLRDIRLETDKTGLLDGLSLVPDVPKELLPGEVEIEVLATGLNFRDVLTALGTYPGGSTTIGGECSGKVLRIGPDVEGLMPADCVLAFAPESFRSRVAVRREFVVVKPPEMTFAEAAGVPVSFLTAVYGLEHLARIRPGQRVLIHAGAGGLGLAAIQIAVRNGAEVYATVGSEEKKAYLERLGVRHIFHSRSSSFREGILEATDGKGVDIALNALSGELLDATFDVVARGGCFLEVGKRGIRTKEEAASLRPDVRYLPFDFGVIAMSNPDLVQRMLIGILEGFVAGTLHPLQVSAFALQDATIAFRSMAQAKHIGKIVLTQKSRGIGAPVAGLLGSGSLMITGGTGAIGRSTALWAAENGAHDLVLVSRRASRDADAEWITELRAKGIRILINDADVSDVAAMEHLLQTITETMPPLVAIFHSAGYLEDAVLLNLTWDSFRRVAAPKIEGAWNLHCLSQRSSAPYLIFYSSVAAIFGSAGQGSYSAANSFLDGLAHYRSSRGMGTLSINWGAWAAGGMATRASVAQTARWKRQGIRYLTEGPALRAAGVAIESGAIQVAIVEQDWSITDIEGTPVHRESFFAEVRPGRSAPNPLKPSELVLLEQLRDAPESTRLRILSSSIRQFTREVLDLDDDFRIDDDIPLQEIGLDSLMALEMRNLLAAATNRSLGATLLFDYPTVRRLANHLLSQLFEESTLPKSPADIAKPKPSDLTTMSEEEAERQLQEALGLVDGRPTHA